MSGPLSVADYERLAEERLEPGPWAYLAGGSGDEWTLRENRAAVRSADRKGWRWVGEMHEIARSMSAQDLPTGFHEAAAEVFRRASEES